MKNCLPALAAAAVGLMSSAAPIVAVHAQEGLSIANNDSVYIDGSTFKVSPGKAKGDVSAQTKKSGARELGAGAIIFRSADRLYIIEAAAASNGDRAFANDPTRPYAYDPGDTRRFMYDQHSDPRRFAVDPARPYAYDPGDSRRFAIDPSRPYAYDPGDSRRFAVDPARPYAYDPGDSRRFAVDPARPDAYDPGDSRRFAVDPARPYAYDPGDSRRFAVDPARPYAYDPGDPRRFAVDATRPFIYDPINRLPVYVNDPDYAQYRLKKAFDENWTVVSAKQ